MYRSVTALLLAGLIWTVSPVKDAAADWTQSTFPVKNHNFGVVAVAAKTEFRFPVVNTFGSDIHLRTVRASCGCTTPIIETHQIKAGETGTILARFNTNTFRGKKGATLTVVMDRPFYSEVRLRVDGYIRSDMVFHPGSVEFGKVEQGKPIARTSKLMYAGRSDWKVMELKTNQPWLRPSFKEVTRANGRIDYELTVEVSEDAPDGFFQDEITIVTNDRSMPRVPLRIAGTVESALSIAPKSIALGSLKPGEKRTVQMVLKGRAPFTVGSIDAPGFEVDFTPTNAPRSAHIVKATFMATEAVGDQKIAVQVTTAGEESVSAKATLTANVRTQ